MDKFDEYRERQTPIPVVSAKDRLPSCTEYRPHRHHTIAATESPATAAAATSPAETAVTPSSSSSSSRVNDHHSQAANDGLATSSASATPTTSTTVSPDAESSAKQRAEENIHTLADANQVNVVRDDDGGFGDSNSNAMIVEDDRTAGNHMSEEKPEGSRSPLNAVHSAVSHHPIPAQSNTDYSLKQDQLISFGNFGVHSVHEAEYLPLDQGHATPVAQNTPIDDPVLPVHGPRACHR